MKLSNYLSNKDAAIEISLSGVGFVGQIHDYDIYDACLGIESEVEFHTRPLYRVVDEIKTFNIFKK